MTLIHFLSAILLAAPQAASSPFNGTWLMDLSSVTKDSKPEHLAIERGIFSRGDPKSALKARADGSFHRISGDDRYVDAVAVTILNRRQVRELDRLNGKLVYSVDYDVSPDGNSMIKKVVDFSKPDHKPIPTTITYRRVGQPQRVGSLVSGRWQTVSLATTQGHLTETIKLNATQLSNRGPGGWGFDALIGGPPVPIDGDAADARVAIEMPNDRTIIQKMSLGGKPTAALLVTMTLQPDHRTITVKSRRMSDGDEKTWVLRKQ